MLSCVGGQVQSTNPIIQLIRMSFAELKKKSKFGFDNLTKEIEKLQNPSTSDERVWKPELDKSGNGYAVIRFLTAPEGEELPWAKVYSHAFQGTGGWLIENCPTSKGEQCPICAANTKLWNSGIEADKEIVRQRKRKLSYYSNIYVVSDPANPENEGKVFIFKYGKKIFDKIQSVMKPEYGDEEALNPFDFWQGANFKLKIKKVAGYWNYDDSNFAAPSTLGNFSDDKLEEIWRSQYSLTEFTDDKNFKSQEELTSRLNVVLNEAKSAKVDRETYEDEEEYTPPVRSSFTEMKVSAASKKPAATDDDDDDALSYFARLAEED